MRFKLGSLLLGFEEVQSEFIFSGITYYAEGEDSAKGYVGSMPFNLTFSDAEPVLFAKVGGPPNASGASANETYRFHRWNFENYILQVVFLSKTLMLRRVFAFLPLKEEESSEAHRHEGASLRRL